MLAPPVIPFLLGTTVGLTSCTDLYKLATFISGMNSELDPSLTEHGGQTQLYNVLHLIMVWVLILISLILALFNAA